MHTPLKKKHNVSTKEDSNLWQSQLSACHWQTNRITNKHESCYLIYILRNSFILISYNSVDSIQFVKRTKQQMNKNEQKKPSHNHLTFVFTTENNLFSLEDVQAIGISQRQYSVLEHTIFKKIRSLKKNWTKHLS